MKQASPDSLRAYIEEVLLAHQLEWARHLAGAEVDWTIMLGLHLRLVELEHLEEHLEDLLL